MQQQQLRQPARTLLEGGQVERALRQRSVGARKQENTVRLAQTQMSPGAVRRVAAIEHDVVRGLEIGEPFRRLIRRARIENRRARSHLGQRHDQKMRGRWVLIEPVLQRHDGEGLGPFIVGGRAGRVLQPLYQHLHEIHHHARMTGDERVESRRAHAQKLGIAQRHELRRMTVPARYERHLADRLAGWHMGD